jgi:putative endonuclease
MKFKTQAMHYVYVLVSEIKRLRFYVGMSEDVDKRLLDHNSGKTKSTKGYRPWKLFFTEEYITRLEARKREKYLKSGIGKEKIKKKWADSDSSLTS